MCRTRGKTFHAVRQKPTLENSTAIVRQDRQSISLGLIARATKSSGHCLITDRSVNDTDGALSTRDNGGPHHVTQQEDESHRSSKIPS